MATPFVPVPLPMEQGKKTRRPSSLGSTSSSSDMSCKCQGENNLKGSTPLNGLESTVHICSLEAEERPLTPTLLGYEVMEERAKFTVYKVLVRKSHEESWVVFRRYTDFSRLNEKLREVFPSFRLSLPPKRWFRDNYNPEFLEDRQLGLQAFLQNLVAHKDVANCVAVREFLCLDDPPGPFDSLEESRAFCETLEETNYRLQREVVERQREIDWLKRSLEEKQLLVDVLEKRLSVASFGQENLEIPCGLSGQRSESSTDMNAESSTVEADQCTEEEKG